MKRLNVRVLIFLLALAAVIIMIKMNSTPRTEASELPAVSAGPPDERGYPLGRVITVNHPVRLSGYYDFLDSLSARHSHFRYHSLPGERLILMANSRLLDERIRLADAHPDSVILPAGSQLNIPDSLTALSFHNTLRTSVLWLNCSNSQAYVTSGLDTLFCAEFQMTDSMGRWDTSDSMNGVILRAHRRTCRYPCLHSIHQPALEISLEKIPVPLIITSDDNRDSAFTDDGFNFIWFATSDIWVLYYLLPPGTPVRWNVVQRENAVRIWH